MITAQIFAQVNWIAILLGGVLSMLLGFLWYGPLFGKLWLRSIGKKQEELRSSPGMYILAFVAAVVQAYVLAALVNGLFLRNTISYWLLFAFYQLVLYAIEGAAFAVWKL